MHRRSAPPGPQRHLAVTAVVLFAACSGSNGGPVDSGTGLQLPPDAVRLAEQATFGPTVETVRDIEARGPAAWVDAQLALPPSSLGQPPVIPDDVNAVCPPGSPGACYRDSFTPFLVQTAFFRNAVSGPDQLRQRVAFALSQLFVVSGDEVRPAYAMAAYEQLLLDDAFANFRQVLEDVTLSPAMGRYLNMVNNDRPDPAKGSSPNENYARELLQLFSIGLVELRPDGSVVVGADGTPVPTYDQDAVEDLARVFTGWTYPPRAGATVRTHDPAHYLGRMVSVASNHDPGSKRILSGVVVPAGQTPEQDLAVALDTVFRHPNVGPFVGRQLIQQLVTANPSPAYVGRVAAVFANDGHGVRGNLGAVVRAVLLDAEARGDVRQDAAYGKVKEPVLFLTQWARALGVATDGVFLASAAAALEQPPYRSPSVFNFYPPDYPLSDGLVSPASAVLDSGSTFTRGNVLWRLLSNPPGPDATVVGATGTQVPGGDLLGAAGSPEALASRLDVLLLHGTMSTSMRTAIADAVSARSRTDVAGRRRAAVMLVGTSPAFQVER